MKLLAERIEDAYFGERNDDELHESLRSYYKKSSYGQLDITGVVTPVIRAPRTYAYYKSITNSSTQTDLIDGIIRLALKTLDSTYDYHDFDTNGDNIIDAIWLVYSGPIDNGGNSMFWAFTYWSYMEDQFDGIDVSHMLGQLINSLMKVAILITQMLIQQFMKQVI